VGGAAGARTTSPLPPLPPRWPRTLQIGPSDDPGGAAALRRVAPFGFRYQYLAGGVNTGKGWSTWNPNGTFASLYVQDSWRHGVVPVLTYYMLLQSTPGGGDELHADLTNLRDPQTMSAYWSDVRLLFDRVRGAKPVVVHVEPDLWGYLEQAGETQLASAFAQRWLALRDELAPNVVLAYHMSGWGTKHDIVYEDPPDATVRSYAARSAAFYRSLRAKFDIAFEDFSDRDAGFYAKIAGNPKTWFAPADFRRHLLYAQTFVRLAGLRIVAWQIPLGNTVMRAMNNTWTTSRTTASSGCSAPARARGSGRTPRPGSPASSSVAAPTARPARATRRRTASRTRRRSTATRAPRSRRTTTAATSRCRRARTTAPARSGFREPRLPEPGSGLTRFSRQPGSACGNWVG
jgi:hypothetical protein